MANIIITGVTQCGKSIVLSKIKHMLEKEFGATVICEGSEVAQSTEQKLANLAEWEKDMIRKEKWRLQEINSPAKRN